MEPIEQGYEQPYHEHYGKKHQVEQARRVLQLVVASLELTVLTRLFLHVEVDVAVLVATLLVVDCRIDKAELLADTGHEVWGTIDDGVLLQGIEQADLGRLIVANTPEALGQGSIGACRLVDVAIGTELLEGLLRKVARQQRVGHVGRIDECQGRGVIGHEGIQEVDVLEVLAHALKRLSLEEGIVVGNGQLIATHQIGELGIGNGILGFLVDDAARADVVEIVQHLSRIVLKVNFLLDVENGLGRLLRETYIIEIGGENDVVLALGISHTATLMFVKPVLFLLDTMNAPLRSNAVVVEELVLRLSLAETHALNISNKLLDEVVGRDAIEQRISTIVVHPSDVVECQIVEGLSLSVAIAIGKGQCLLSIDASRIERAIMELVRTLIQHVDFVVSTLLTCRQE